MGMIDNRTHGERGIKLTLSNPGDAVALEVEGLWSVERDMIPMDSIMPEPDPYWVYTDEHSHTHRWVRVGREAHSEVDSWDLPTLEYIITGETGYDDGCGQTDVILDGEYRCRECGEVVVPGTRTPEPGRMVAGPVRWSARVEMTAKQVVSIPRSWLDHPIHVLTPVGWGKAHIVAVVPGDYLGCMYEVELRGIGMPGKSGPEDEDA